MNDLGKIAVVAAIMGAIFLFGVLLQPTEPTEQPAPVADTTEPDTVMLVESVSLEMLGPVYSEKAVFQDDTIRIAFDASYVDEDVESRLTFWLHNVSSDAITVLWNRCSMQLPDGNTVNVINEAGLSTLDGLPGAVISIAPSGDLFDAFIPVTHLAWADDAWTISTGVFDAGIFTLVLAIERSPMAHPLNECEDAIAGQAPRTGQAMRTATTGCDECCREVVYYAFRFVMR